MKLVTLLIFCVRLITAVSLFAAPVFAAETVLGDDGREVRLNDDGSWEYASDDRFATTAVGVRVRLKADGSWQLAEPGEGNSVARPADMGAGDRHQAVIAAQSLQLTLTDLVIETFRERRAKITRKQTQMVLQLRITVAEKADNAAQIGLNPASFQVQDSDGRAYPVLSVSPVATRIAAGQSFTVLIRADGSPHWWTTQSMRLLIQAEALGNPESVRLTIGLSQASKKSVDGFDRP